MEVGTGRISGKLDFVVCLLTFKKTCDVAIVNRTRAPNVCLVLAFFVPSVGKEYIAEC